MKRIFTLFVFAFLIMKVSIGQPWTENFDTGLANTYTTGTQTLATGDWYTSKVYQETSGNSRGGSGHAARLNDDVADASLRTPALNTVKTIEFYYRELNSGGGTFVVQKSYNNTDWTDLVSQNYSGKTFTQFAYTVNDNASQVYIRVVSDNNPGHLIIDDFSVTEVLPVELMHMGVSLKKGSTSLSWQTASETNNEYFLIERSTNGKDFTEIGQVKGAGNSAEVINYSFVDEKPAKGRNYYRLRQVDFDKGFTFSKIVSVNFQGEDEFTVFPTKISNELKVSTDEALRQEMNYFIMDNLGRRISLGVLAAGTTDLTIDVSTLNTGNYFIVLYTETTREVHRFVK